MGFDVPMNKSKLVEPEIATDIVTFPVVGSIAAGYDEIAVEDWSGETIDIPASYLRGHKKEEFFVLSVHGDSMCPSTATVCTRFIWTATRFLYFVSPP